MATKCSGCSQRFDSGRVDVAPCPRCGTENKTEHASEIRKDIERNCDQLSYPMAAVRAIGYASAVYGYATHNLRMDTGALESQIASNFGDQWAAERTAVAVVSGREYMGLVDTRACLVIMVVQGTQTSGKWTNIYVVFRGSRGDQANTGDNPEGAGWGFDEHGQPLGNLDWRANFNNRQRFPNWSTDPIRVHEGFLDIYGGVQVTVHQEVRKLLAAHAGAAVIVTGHSLGAAEAVLCAHDLQSRGICEPFCYPFCTPRVGNMHFAIDFRNRLANDYKVLPGSGAATTFSRCINFCQSNDPVSFAGATGFKNPMSQASITKKVDGGGTVARGLYGARKTKNKLIRFYQSPNVYKLGLVAPWHIHQYTSVQRDLLGKALFTR